VAASVSASPSLASVPTPTSAPLPQLYQYLKQVPDPRQAQGRRYALSTLLLLVIVATLAGRTHRQGIFEWGREAEAAMQQALGFQPGKTPAASTLHEVLGCLDWEAFASQLRAWTLALLAALDPDGKAALSCDGKCVRGSLREGATVAHLLSVFVHNLGITVDLEPVAQKSNEIPGAPKLLLRLPVAGRTVVVDALLTQETLAVALVKAGADYVMPVKGNQPGLQEELATIFAEPVPAKWRLERVDVGNKGHGRKEWRRLTLIAPPLGERLDWGRSQQYFLLERYRWSTSDPDAAPVRTVVYGITSLPRERADAAAVLKLVRSHWQIENRSHWIRDVLLREDASHSSKNTIVQVLTAFRCAALTLLHAEHQRSGKGISRLHRRLTQKPWEVLKLTGAPG
jgi:predicted transposase YbfD/YdcC